MFETAKSNGKLYTNITACVLCPEVSWFAAGMFVEEPVALVGRARLGPSGVREGVQCPIHRKTYTEVNGEGRVTRGF